MENEQYKATIQKLDQKELEKEAEALRGMLGGEFTKEAKEKLAIVLSLTNPTP